jgi:hypothetical protein
MVQVINQVGKNVGQHDEAPEYWTPQEACLAQAMLDLKRFHGATMQKKKKTRSRPLTRRYLKIEAVKKLIFATKRHTRIRGHKQSNAMIARALA